MTLVDELLLPERQGRQVGMTTKLASLAELWQDFDIPGTQVSIAHTYLCSENCTLRTA